MTKNETLSKVLKYLQDDFDMTIIEAKTSFEYTLVYEIFDQHEAELKAKDQTISELMDAQDNWIAERADLQAVIEKQGERIRYLEQQFRDLNPKEINQ